MSGEPAAEPPGTEAEVIPPEGRVVSVDGQAGDGRRLAPGRHRLRAEKGR